VYTEDELLARIWMPLPAQRNVKLNSEETTGDLRTRVAKCIQVDGGIYEYLL
jgi:hypothetical protein